MRHVFNRQSLSKQIFTGNFLNECVRMMNVSFKIHLKHHTLRNVCVFLSANTSIGKNIAHAKDSWFMPLLTLWSIKILLPLCRLTFIVLKVAFDFHMNTLSQNCCCLTQHYSFLFCRFQMGGNKLIPFINETPHSQNNGASCFRFSNRWHLHDALHTFDCDPSRFHFLLFYGFRISSIDRKIQNKFSKLY